MADSSPVDMKTHAQTYEGFIKLLKFGTIASFLLAAFVVVLLAS